MGRAPYTFGNSSFTFIGQRTAAKSFGRMIVNAVNRNGVRPPVGLVAGTGMGKTAFAKTLAESLNLKFRVFIVNKKTTADELISFFKSLDYGDVTFLDEAHNLSIELQEICYQVIDSWTIQVRLKLEKSKETKIEIVSISEVHLIFGTDQPGKFQKAFNRRVTWIQLSTYSLKELRAIVLASSERRGLKISSQAAGALAVVSKESPGEAMKLTEGLFFWLEDISVPIRESVVRDFLKSQGIDLKTGLTVIDRQYLSLLNKIPNGRLTLMHLSAHLKYDPDYINRFVEPFLIRKGLIEITFQGRALTAAAYKLLEANNAG